MKKVYYLLLAGFFSCNLAFGQSLGIDKAVLSSTKQLPENYVLKSSATPTDTTGLSSINFAPEFAPAQTVTFYQYTGGGWIYGVNISGNNLNECAQGYVNYGAGSIGIEEVILLFAGKTGVSGDPTSKCVVKVYNMDLDKANNFDDAAANDYSKNSPGPNMLLGQADLLFDDIDTTFGAFNIVPFNSVIGVVGDFAVGVDFTNMKGKQDTAGLVSDQVGEAGELDYAFHKVGANWFVTDFLFSYNPTDPNNVIGSGVLDNNIAIFAVIDINYVGIEDENYLNGMKLDHVAPNPVIGQTQIRYALQNSSNNVTIEVFDATGKKVETFSEGSKGAGVYSVTFDASNVEAGNYYYSVTSDAGRITKKMVVVK